MDAFDVVVRDEHESRPIASRRLAPKTIQRLKMMIFPTIIWRTRKSTVMNFTKKKWTITVKYQHPGRGPWRSSERACLSIVTMAVNCLQSHVDDAHRLIDQKSYWYAMLAKMAIISTARNLCCWLCLDMNGTVNYANISVCVSIWSRN